MANSPDYGEYDDDFESNDDETPIISSGEENGLNKSSNLSKKFTINNPSLITNQSPPNPSITKSVPSTKISKYKVIENGIDNVIDKDINNVTPKSRISVSTVPEATQILEGEKQPALFGLLSPKEAFPVAGKKHLFIYLTF
jgi:hypothetical protein